MGAKMQKVSAAIGRVFKRKKAPPPPVEEPAPPLAAEEPVADPVVEAPPAPPPDDEALRLAVAAAVDEHFAFEHAHPVPYTHDQRAVAIRQRVKRLAGDVNAEALIIDAVHRRLP